MLFLNYYAKSGLIIESEPNRAVIGDIEDVVLSISRGLGNDCCPLEKAREGLEVLAQGPGRIGITVSALEEVHEALKEAGYP